MSRPAAARRASGPATRAGAHARQPLRAVPQRRVSGPAKRPVAVAAPGGLLLGAAGLARTLPDSRALDRLIRGRTWVAVIAVALIGIVAMQVHMLGLNAGIGVAVEKATTLEQENTALRLDVSRLSSGERIAAEAQRLGLVMPNAGEVRYTDVQPTDADRAARAMRSPDPDLAAKAEAAVKAGLGTGASALAPKSAETAPGDTPAPVTADPPATDPVATAPVTPAANQAPQQQQPVQADPVQPQTPVQPQQPVAQQPQQAAVQPQQQTAASQAVTPAGGAAATPGN
jgi:cell division protein FtsL